LPAFAAATAAKKSPKGKSAVKRAAEAIFNHAAKAIEIEDIEARVSELESTTGASTQP
jgi:hypothetical protein